jgi:hypothetical protein
MMSRRLPGAHSLDAERHVPYRDTFQTQYLLRGRSGFCGAALRTRSCMLIRIERDAPVDCRRRRFAVGRSTTEKCDNETVSDALVPARSPGCNDPRRCSRTAGTGRRKGRDHRRSRWRPAWRGNRRCGWSCRRRPPATPLASLLLAQWTVLASHPERKISSGVTSLLPLTTIRRLLRGKRDDQQCHDTPPGSD